MINTQKTPKTSKPYIYRKQIIKTGKYYVGKHNGKNTYYKGSGTEWRKDLKLYIQDRKKDLIEEILEYVDDISDLNSREKYWLEFYDAANNPLYYNLTNKNYGPSITTQETKNKIGNANRKPKPNNFGKSRYKPVLQYDLEDNFIREWSSIKEASLELNINCGRISGCCIGYNNKAGNYKFKYKI